jgi:MinD-like ATPase involved in chromosome partitioning or flagellar assembly
VTQGEPDPEYSDGSVGRYVREQWTADAAARRSRRRASSTLPAPAAGREPQHATPVSGLEVVPPPDTDPAPRVSESRAAGPDIVRPDAAGSPVVPEARVPRTQVPEARTAEHDVAAPHRISPPTPPRGVGRWVDPGAVAAQEAQRLRSGMVGSGRGALSDDPADLSSARLLRPLKRPPQSGWRRVVYVLSGKLINPGESPADVRRRELVARINAPLLGCHKIALLSLKGGVGKTTMTATLGATFASLRGDRVVAVDANPDRGTLSQKIPLETSATVRHLLRDAQRVRRYTDVRAYTSQGLSRLEVLASEQDPAVSEAFSEDDYRRTVNLLEHFYNMVLTDCGTGLMHSAMYGVLGVADQIVVVSSGSIDGARSASATMDWLDAHGHGDLVRNAVAVINCVSRSAGGVDLDRVAAHFAGRCRAVVRVPFDPHLQEGAEVDLDRLDPRTRLGLLELAAEVADAFPS